MRSKENCGYSLNSPFARGCRMGARYKNSYYYAITPAPIINSNNMRIIPAARALKTNENTM